MKKSKNIGIVLATYPGYSETFLTNKIKSLVQSGIDVIVFPDRNQNDPLRICKEVVAYQIPKNTLFRYLVFFGVLSVSLLSNPLRFVRFIQLERKDQRSWSRTFINAFKSSHLLNYSLDWIHFEFATLAIGRENVGLAIGAKTSVSVRGFDISIYPLQHNRCYENLWKKVDKLHVISDDLFDRARQEGFPEYKPWTKITPAILTDGFIPKDNLGSISDPLQIISVGRLEWKKGFEYAIRACVLLKNTGINFHYRIIGDGSEHDQLLFSILQQGMINEIVLLGKLSHPETIEQIRRADLYLQPSVQEGFCNALLEAQACGLLCIATDAEGLSENLLNGETGWIVPKLNPDVIAKKITDVINLSADERARICLNAVDRVKSKYTIESQALKFVEFYNS